MEVKLATIQKYDLGEKVIVHFVGVVKRMEVFGYEDKRRVVYGVDALDGTSAGICVEECHILPLEEEAVK